MLIRSDALKHAASAAAAASALNADSAIATTATSIGRVRRNHSATSATTPSAMSSPIVRSERYDVVDPRIAMPNTSAKAYINASTTQSRGVRLPSDSASTAAGSSSRCHCATPSVMTSTTVLTAGHSDPLPKSIP